MWYYRKRLWDIGTKVQFLLQNSDTHAVFHEITGLKRLGFESNYQGEKVTEENDVYL
jgi:hypothetical protein